MRPGRTIVVGTDAGLYCRMQMLAQPRLVFSSVDEHGQHLGEHDLDLSQPRQLLECGLSSPPAVNLRGVLQIFNLSHCPVPMRQSQRWKEYFCVLAQGGKRRVFLGAHRRHRLQDGF